MEMGDARNRQLQYYGGGGSGGSEDRVMRQGVVSSPAQPVFSAPLSTANAALAEKGLRRTVIRIGPPPKREDAMVPAGAIMLIDPVVRPGTADGAGTGALPGMFTSFAGMSVDLASIQEADWALVGLGTPDKQPRSERNAAGARSVLVKGFYATGTGLNYALYGQDAGGAPHAVSAKDFHIVLDMALRHRYKAFIYQGFSMSSSYEIGNDSQDGSGITVQEGGSFSRDNDSGHGIVVGTAVGIRFPTSNEIMFPNSTKVVGASPPQHHGASGGGVVGARARLIPMHQDYTVVGGVGRNVWAVRGASGVERIDPTTPSPLADFIVGPIGVTINQNSLPGKDCDINLIGAC